MRTTVTLDDETLSQAAELSGIRERSALIQAALESLIRSERARRLAALGGSDPEASAAPRDRDRRRVA